MTAEYTLWRACERAKLELPEQVDLVRASYRRHGAKYVTVEEVMNQRGLAQLVGLDHVVHQAPLQRGGGIDPARAEEQVEAAHEEEDAHPAQKDQPLP